MRNSLSEIPILLCCIWGGIIAGLASSLLRLPRKAYIRTLKGRRANPLLLILFFLLDLLSAAAIAAVFMLTLLHANGGELRLFAVCGFIIGGVATSYAVNGLGKPLTDKKE